MRALGFQTLVQTWMTNRPSELGEATVVRAPLPVFNAGLAASLTADADGTKRHFRKCTAAAEALARERTNLEW